MSSLVLRRVCAALAIALVPATALASDVAPAVVPDPQIASALARVSAASLRATDERLVGFGTRNLFSERLASRTRGVFPARDYIAARFREFAKTSGGRLSVRLDTFLQPKTTYTPRAVTTSSVIATLRGDDPQRGVIVVSSHYDSRNSDGNDATLDAPGADDNGSGTSAVLEAARVLAPLQPHATIVFACFDGEEQGLFGSAHFAKALHDAGVRVEANINDDIVGASLGPGGERAPSDVRLFSEALPAGVDAHRVNVLGSENDSPARELARSVREIDAAYVPMNVALIYRSDRFLRGGDQQSFAEQGFPAVRFVEPRENFAHQHQNVRVENGVQFGDLLQYVDFDYLARVTQLNAAALADLALAPAAPAPKLAAKTLAYDSTLSWEPVAGATAYEVVWRRTDEPVWTHTDNVGNALTATLPLEKDDWLFGVRSVDARGHVSVVAFPVPVR